MVIKDRWLGLMRHTFSLLILAYIVVSVILQDPEGFVETGTPVGTVRMSLRRVRIRNIYILFRVLNIHRDPSLFLN